jgi:hypothetical protein
MAASAPDPILLNSQYRSIIVGNSVRMTQPIYGNSVNPNNQPTINIPLNNVGLLLGLLVEVSGNVTNAITNTATRTNFGSSNILQNITFTDLNNIQRINTTGYMLAMLNSARQGFGFGGAYAPNLPMNYGNNWAPFAGPATIAPSATGDVRHTYWVPIAYSLGDLRGAIYAAVLNATMNLQLTIASSAQVGVATGADALNAIYIGNDNIAWTGNVTVNVTQVYLDQLPTNNQRVPLLPFQDLNTIYDIKYAPQSGMAVNQDFLIPYANQRQFLSTFAVVDNGGTYNVGSDVNWMTIQAANMTQITKVSPNIAALMARQTFMADPPPGVYYFDHRDRPIDTITYGNQALVFNMATVNANAQIIVGYEAFTMVNQLPLASSLPST